MTQGHVWHVLQVIFLHSYIQKKLAHAGSRGPSGLFFGKPVQMESLFFPCTLVCFAKQWAGIALILLWSKTEQTCKHCLFLSALSLRECCLYEKENSLHHCLLPVCDFPDKSKTQFCLCSNAAELWYLLWWIMKDASQHDCSCEIQYIITILEGWQHFYLLPEYFWN